MLDKHKRVFFAVADKFKVWIGVREPNELSDRWIGRPGYVPKCVECKAKTADEATHKFAGLVVNPVVCPDAFMPRSALQALSTWREFLQLGRLPFGFVTVASGPEKGLVKHNGFMIHADYDLMTICRSNVNGDFVETEADETKTDRKANVKQLGEQEQLYSLVVPEINSALKVPMIQHGAEFAYTEGIGARESELVLWFGPGSRFKLGQSSMPKDGH